jgi:hypothetical protein
MVALTKKSAKFPQGPLRVRAQDHRYRLGAKWCSKSNCQADLREATYAECDRLESCSKDPIGYMDGYGLYCAFSSRPYSYVDPSGLARVTGSINFDAAEHTKRGVRNGWYGVTLDYSFDIECDGKGGYNINQAPQVDNVDADWFPDSLLRTPIGWVTVEVGFDSDLRANITDLGCAKPTEACIRIDLMFTPYHYIEAFRMFRQAKLPLRTEHKLDTWGYPIRAVYDLKCCCGAEEGPTLIMKQWTEGSYEGMLWGKGVGRVFGGRILCGNAAPTPAPKQKTKHYVWPN